MICMPILVAATIYTRTELSFEHLATTLGGLVVRLSGLVLGTEGSCSVLTSRVVTTIGQCLLPNISAPSSKLRIAFNSTIIHNLPLILLLFCWLPLLALEDTNYILDSRTCSKNLTITSRPKPTSTVIFP